jgi:Protein CHAPERONE-LIKE PROTEIN OF POR1-like
MNEQNPYEQLGLNEDASFDEIKAARDRLTEEHTNDRKQVERLEAAYDAILMDRLRMRQEGKIKVPEGIRFPERLVSPPPSSPPVQVKQSPAWMQRLLDTPTRNDILLPAGLFAALAALSVLAASTNIQQLSLAIAIGLSLYFINRKENLFGRAILLTLCGLLFGLLLGGLLFGLFQAPLTGVLTDGQFITLLTLIVLWLVCSFLR